MILAMFVLFSISILVIFLIAGWVATFCLWFRQRRTDHPAKAESGERLLLFETVARNAAESIIITDPAESIRYVNAAFTRLLGYEPEEVCGKTPSCFRDDDVQDTAHKGLKEALKQGQDWQGVFRNRAKDGTRVALDTHISPVFAPDRDQPIAFIAVGRDLTYEQQLEQQLRYAQKMEAIGTLAGGIAHDFNNILSAIIGYTELSILDEQDGHPVRDNLMQIMRAAKRAADLVDQILTFSRRNAASRQALYLNPILKESLKLMRGTLPTSIEIQHEISEKAPPIHADPTQMHQIIMNLCTNAGQAMRAHGGTLTVRLDAVVVDDEQRELWQTNLMAGSYLRLQVEDSGHGMPPEIAARIFEPYFTTKRGGDGTGLGLATVHGIINSHHGCIHVDTAPDTGSTFTVLLPACPPDLILPAQPNIDTPVPRGNESILVVDDEESISLMLSTALTYLGYKVQSFTSAVKALEAFEHDPDAFDCIISDQTMPTLSGADFAQRVFSIRPAFPFVLCTGFSESINEAKAAELGIGAFVMKPVTGRCLADVVYRLLHP